MTIASALWPRHTRLTERRDTLQRSSDPCARMVRR